MTNDAEPTRWREAVREAIAAGTSNDDELIRALLIARSRIASERAELSKASGLLDSLESFRGVTASADTSESPTVARPERATQIATRLWAAERKGVKTEDVAAELRRLGDQTNSRDLTVAVGNILSRRGWERVKGGVYVPAGEGVPSE